MKSFKELLDRLAAALYAGPSAATGPALVEPFFRDLWVELERALGEGRVWITPEHQAWHEQVDLVLHPEDYAKWIAPWLGQIDAALASQRSAMLTRLRYPAEAKVRVQFVAAALDVHPIQRGAPMAFGRARGGPEGSNYGVVRSSTDFGPPPTDLGRVAEDVQRRDPTGGTPGSLVRLSWRDHGGARTAELRPGETLGREPDNTAVVRAPADAAGDLGLVSRHALHFSRCPTARGLLARNIGSLGLVAEGTDGERVALAPQQPSPVLLPRSGVVVWPGKRAERGFELRFETCVAGWAILTGPSGAQRVALQRPASEVVGDALALGVDGVRFTVDLGSEGTRIRNTGSVPASCGGDVAAELFPATGKPVQFGRVRVEIQVEGDT
ncbi:MAG: hypothetical protein V4850_17630 [Myxococcota bacterium]